MWAVLSCGLFCRRLSALRNPRICPVIGPKLPKEGPRFPKAPVAPALDKDRRRLPRSLAAVPVQATRSPLSSSSPSSSSSSTSSSFFSPNPPHHPRALHYRILSVAISPTPSRPLLNRPACPDPHPRPIALLALATGESLPEAYKLRPRPPPTGPTRSPSPLLHPRPPHPLQLESCHPSPPASSRSTHPDLSTHPPSCAWAPSSFYPPGRRPIRLAAQRRLPAASDNRQRPTPALCIPVAALFLATTRFN